MALGSNEIERIVDESVAGRGIDTSLFCATCGYNLRGLPYLGICPECGHRYNARARKMTGIFLPHQLEFPFSDIFASAFSLALTVGLIVITATGGDRSWTIPAAGVFGVLALMFVRLAYRKVATYLRFYRLLRRIEAEEDG